MSWMREKRVLRNERQDTYHAAGSHPLSRLLLPEALHLP